MPALKHAAVWAEKVYYAECPYCSQCNTIGTEGDSGFDGSEQTCALCEKSFIIDGEPE